MVSDLPPEILLKIATELVQNPRDNEILKGLEDLGNFALVSTSFNQIAQEAAIWEAAARKWNSSAPLSFKVSTPSALEPGVQRVIKQVYNIALNLWKSPALESHNEGTKAEMLKFIQNVVREALYQMPSITPEKNIYAQYRKIIVHLNQAALSTYPQIPRDNDPLKQHDLVNRYIKEHLSRLKGDEFFNRQMGWTGFQGGFTTEMMFLLRPLGGIVEKKPHELELETQTEYANFILSKISNFLSSTFSPNQE